MIITIDGPAGAGKSSTSKLISERMKIDYYNSGLTYRGITFAVLDILGLQSFENIDEVQISKILDKMNLYNTGQHVIYNGKYIPEKKLRSLEINKYVGILSKFKNVREKAKDCLQKFMQNNKGSVIFEGRDMGTSIFPNADIKFYLASTLEERSRRRALIDSHSYQEAMNDILGRDEHDRNRTMSPLKLSEDAILIDNSEMSLEKTVTEMIRIIEDKKSCK